MAPSKEACAVAMAMAAPFLATMASSNINSANKAIAGSGNGEIKRRRTSSDALQRTVSDVSYELHHHQQHSGGVNKQEKVAAETEKQQQHHHQPPLQPVPEVQDAKCECCGMSEECTPEYIRGVRGRFAGRWICGLCAEAVTEEAEKNKGDGGMALTMEAALKAHMGVCKRFNGFGRTHPVLFQAEAMREILRRRAKLGPRSRSSINPREVREVAAKGGRGGGGTGIARSSSCMPFMREDDFNDDRVASSSNKN